MHTDPTTSLRINSRPITKTNSHTNWLIRHARNGKFIGFLWLAESGALKMILCDYHGKDRIRDQDLVAERFESKSKAQDCLNGNLPNPLDLEQVLPEGTTKKDYEIVREEITHVTTSRIVSPAKKTKP
jgi:hypothetical protein